MRELHPTKREYLCEMKARLTIPILFLLLAIGASAQSVRITQGPKVEDVTVERAIIAWSTDGSSNTVVHYGKNANDLSQQTTGSDSNGTHRVTIPGLDMATTYYFVVESGGAQSAVQSFTTKAPAGAEPQSRDANDSRILVGPLPQQVVDSSAAIFWMTAESNKSELMFGTQKDQLTMSGMQDVSNSRRQHYAVLQPLRAESTYYYVIVDPDGRRVEGQFFTEPQNYRDAGRVYTTAGPVLEYLDSSSAVIAWSTNVNASTRVRYSQDPNDFSQIAQAPWGQETHRVTLKNLKPDSTYYFVCESGQGEGSGTMSKSNVGRFRTLRHGEEPLRDIVAVPKR
jgi:hypothetical protein